MHVPIIIITNTPLHCAKTTGVVNIETNTDVKIKTYVAISMTTCLECDMCSHN